MEENGAAVGAEPGVFTLPSGARLRVTVAAFADASGLTKALLKNARIDASTLQVDLSKLAAGPRKPGDLLRANPGALAEILNRLCGMATSDEVEAALFRCAERAAYTPPGEQGSLPVKRALFDDPKWGGAAREDYYSICARVVEVNCTPFFAKTFSALFAPAVKVESSRG